MKPTAQETTKTRLRKSETGRIGSAALRSTRMKPASPKTAEAMSTPLQSEVHPIACPPNVVNSITAVSSTASRPAPAKSIAGRLRVAGVGKVQPMTATDTRPSGRLT